MKITPPIMPGSAVTGAYSSSKSLANDPSASVDDKNNGFEKLVKQAATDAVNTIREGEAAIQSGLEGKIEMQQVVEATMAMESTLKVSIALRDKLVSAYQEILRMPI